MITTLVNNHLIAAYLIAPGKPNKRGVLYSSRSLLRSGPFAVDDFYLLAAVFTKTKSTLAIYAKCCDFHFGPKKVASFATELESVLLRVVSEHSRQCVPYNSHNILQLSTIA